MTKLTPALNGFLIDNLYVNIKEVPGHGICALERFIFTVGIVCGLDWAGKSHRYCYHTLLEASQALNEWSGDGHPPGNWIKRKGYGEDVPNPDYVDPR